MKYIKPIWYFNLKPKIGHAYFPALQVIREEGLAHLIDKDYNSEAAMERDAAYWAFQSGYINRNEQAEGIDIWREEDFPIEDEYRFCRKAFHPFWSLFVLMIRLFSFHHPIREVTAWFKNRKLSRKTIDDPIDYPDYDSHTSSLVEQKPLVTVVIPTLNRYPYLRDVLRDLEKQSYKNFEVIVVDQSDPYDRDFYSGWNLNLRYWYQEEKALWKARNEAIKKAKGNLLLLYDDDSRVEKEWIIHHLKTLDFFNAEISSGVSISRIGAKVPAHYSYFRWSDQLDTGNVMIKREVFEEIGLFDLNFEGGRMGDAEFGLRAYLGGLKNISNPLARRIHLKVESGGLRDLGSWDAFRPTNFFSPRPIPSTLYLSFKYFPISATIYLLLYALPTSYVPVKYKRKPHNLLWGYLISILLFPFVLFNLFRSLLIAYNKRKKKDTIKK